MTDRMVLTLAWASTAAAVILSLISGAVPAIGTLAGIVCIIAIVFWVIKYRRWRALNPKGPKASSPSTADTSAAPIASTHLMPLRRGTGAVVAVGEQHHTKTLNRAWKLVADPDHVMVALIPEPTNKHDSNAVRLDILIDGAAFTAGYIARSESASYARALLPLTERGVVGVGDGKIRLDQSGQFQVYARLSDDPKTLVPPAIDDPAGEFVDGNFDLAVTGEEAYQDTIKPHAHRKYPVPFALHQTTIEKGKHQGLTTFAVYLDGQLVGQLTRAMAVKHFHVIDNVIRSGKLPYLAGRIDQDHRGHQVILDGPSIQRGD